MEDGKSVHYKIKESINITYQHNLAYLLVAFCEILVFINLLLGYKDIGFIYTVSIANQNTASQFKTRRTMHSFLNCHVYYKYLGYNEVSFKL